MKRNITAASLLGFWASLGLQNFVAWGQELTINSVQIDEPYMSQQEAWLQPITDPWLSTTVSWETAEWRYANVVDLAAQFGDDSSYFSNQDVVFK